jgi:DNA-binding CsgD family transcriptional regulator
MLVGRSLPALTKATSTTGPIPHCATNRDAHRGRFHSTGLQADRDSLSRAGPLSVSRSKAGPGARTALRDAREAFVASHWERAIALLSQIHLRDRAERIEAAFLLARAALRAGLPTRALVALDDIADLLNSTEQSTEAEMLRGTALVRLGSAAVGLPILQRAAAEANASLRAEAGYALALAHFGADELDDAEAILDKYGDPEAGIMYARALQLYGWIEVRRARYPIAARHFLDSLGALRASTQNDSVMAASLLCGLTSIARDTFDLKLFARVRVEVDALPWSPELEAQWLVTNQDRAFVELLDGRADEAWRLADETVSQSATGAQRVGALITASRVARAAGDAFTPDRLVLKAAAMALQIDWASTGADERAALLSAIADTAELDADLASGLLVLYEALPRARSRAESLDGIRCPGPLEDLARAAVARAHGDTRGAVTRLHSAVAAWRARGDRFDEARALLALIEVGSSLDMLQRADEVTRIVPRSWLRRRFAVLAERARGIELLSRAEHRVMLAICEGRSTGEIAARFGRSRNTIRNQTRRVYSVMAVGTRSALVSKCAALGIVVGTG